MNTKTIAKERMGLKLIKYEKVKKKVYIEIYIKDITVYNSSSCFSELKINKSMNNIKYKNIYKGHYSFPLIPCNPPHHNLTGCKVSLALHCVELGGRQKKYKKYIKKNNSPEKSLSKHSQYYQNW